MRGNCFIEAAGQFGGRDRHIGRVIASIDHLQFHSIESGIAVQGRAQGRAAVSLLPQFPFEFQDKIAVFLFAEQPGSARLAAVQHAHLDAPLHRFLGRIADVIPLSDQPTFRDSFLWEERDKTCLGTNRFALFCCGGGHRPRSGNAGRIRGSRLEAEEQESVTRKGEGHFGTHCVFVTLWGDFFNGKITLFGTLKRIHRCHNPPVPSK